MPNHKDASKADPFCEHYGVLKRMAHARLRPHKTFTLLNTTSLVNESYLRLLAAKDVRQDNHAEFLAYVGQVMRSVIVDAAREKLAKRRGEGAHHIEFDDALAIVADQPAQEIVDVHDALCALTDAEPELAKVLELEYFAGMTDAEIAECVGVSDRTVRRQSSKAHLMLRAMLA
jgi:RNA polymerase sigma factor (TIGR02999 family)